VLVEGPCRNCAATKTSSCTKGMIDDIKLRADAVPRHSQTGSEYGKVLAAADDGRGSPARTKQESEHAHGPIPKIAFTAILRTQSRTGNIRQTFQRDRVLPAGAALQAENSKSFELSG